MSRHRVRIDLYVIARSLPAVIGIGEQVLHLEGMLRIKTEITEVQPDPSRVGVIRTQVDNDQDNVGSIGSTLAVANQLISIRRMKAQALQPMQRGILGTNPIYQADELF